MSRRSRAREVVLQVLYQDDMNSNPDAEILDRFLKGRLQGDAKLVAFAKDLVGGVRVHKAELDRSLDETADNWRLSRMTVTDRNVLRLGAYEILFTETPDRVAINEAIELAKRYGTNNSSQFVNGILDRLLKKQSTPKSTPAASSEKDLPDTTGATDEK